MTDKSVELNSSITLINDKLHFNAIVEGNDPISIDYTINLAEDKYCPVWAMLKGNVEIEIKHNITT